MAQLSGIARALVRIVFGTDLPTGTHAEALQHYRRATELNPTRMIHRCAARLEPCRLCLPGQRWDALRHHVSRHTPMCLARCSILSRQSSQHPKQFLALSSSGGLDVCETEPWATHLVPHARLKAALPCRVELGRALAKMGQKEAALQELEQAVTMEEEDINAHLQKVLCLFVSLHRHQFPVQGLSCAVK